MVLIVLAVPLILGVVPPNPLYGFRIPRTMRPHVWYPANRVAGLAMAAAGVVWLLASWIAPPAHEPVAQRIGWAALAVAVAFSFWWVYRRT